MTTPAMGVLPASGLKPDTLLAAGAARDQIGYLGVWAPDYVACASVDQAGSTGYVVITGTSLRQGSDTLAVTAMPATAGKATLAAGDKTVEIVQVGPDAISVNGTPMVRCTTP